MYDILLCANGQLEEDIISDDEDFMEYIGSGEIDISQYCDFLRDRIISELITPYLLSYMTTRTIKCYTFLTADDDDPFYEGSFILRISLTEPLSHFDSDLLDANVTLRVIDFNNGNRQDYDQGDHDSGSFFDLESEEMYQEECEEIERWISNKDFVEFELTND